MELSSKFKRPIDIEEYYGLNFRSLWTGVKQEPPAFWFVCIYLFLEYVRPATIYPVIDILPWTQIVLLLAIVFSIADKNIKWVRNSATTLVFLFFFVLMLSVVFAFSPSISLDAIDIPILWILAYLLIINIVSTPKRLFIFLLLFFLVNFKMSQHGFFSFAMRGFSYAKWGVTGSPGWFHDAGDFGTAMTVFVPLIVCFILALRSKWGKYKRILFYFIALTGIVTIIATSSRGAQLGFVAVAGWYVLKSRNGFKAIMLAVIAGVLIYFLLPEKMLSEFHSIGEDSTSQNRLAHWAFGMDVLRDNPLLGVGYNNWLFYCDYKNPYGLVQDHRGYCLDPHNTYVEALAELGVVGTIFYLLIALHILRLNKKTRNIAQESDNKLFFYVAHGLDGGLIGYLASSFFFTQLFYPFLWIQLALTAALSQVVKHQTQASTCRNGRHLEEQATPG